jgi:hypothetical protein
MKSLIWFSWMLTGNLNSLWYLYEPLSKLRDFLIMLPFFRLLEHISPPANHQFKFELAWLQREGFHDMVKSVWNRPVVDSSPIQRWNNKPCSLRSHLSGWARHVTGILKKEKLRLSSIIDDLEALAEVHP